MSDLQKIRESILAKAHQEGQAHFKEEEAHIVAVIEQKREELLNQCQIRRQELLDTETQSLIRQQQQVKNYQRQSALKQQNALVDELFKGAEERLANASSQETLEFMKHILAQHSHESLELVLTQHTRSVLGNEGIQQLTDEFPQISVASSDLKHSAGFILREGKVDYNYCYDQLIQGLRDELGVEMTKKVLTITQS